MSSRIPFWIVSVVLGLAAVCAIIVRWTEWLPITPWEASIAMEAIRFNAGLPLYEPGHATHIYGPLLTLLLAAVFRVFGLNLLAARIVFSLFGFALAILLSTILCRDKSRGHWLLAALLFFSVSLRTNLIFLTAQPDCAAVCCAVLGLYLWVTGDSSRKVEAASCRLSKEKAAGSRFYLRSLVSLALFVCAVLLKQTAAAFALIPIVYVLLWQRPLNGRVISRSVIPAAVIALALLMIRLFYPQMFSAVVEIPAAIKVYAERAPGLILYLFLTFPLFIIALLIVIFQRKRPDERERWIWSALVVLIPTSIWTICKSGGSENSLLFAYLAMTALFVVKFESLSGWMTRLPKWKGFAAATAVALVMIVSFGIEFRRDVALLFARCGDEKYDAVVSLLQGGGYHHVISPQDPTIAYRATGNLGRALFFELDTHAVNGNWPAELPASMQEELAQADCVVQVNSYVPTPVFERGLREYHFHPMTIETLRDSAYTLWTKEGI
ncbi:MAG: hypothetical protein QOG67_41 [Verrucomicrobiota bacterium]|jgi:hypothetical protein